MTPEAQNLYQGFIDKGYSIEDSKNMSVESINKVVHELMISFSSDIDKTVLENLDNIKQEILDI